MYGAITGVADGQRSTLDQSLPDHLPTVTTIREIFTRYVDINAVPRRSFFALLKHFAQDDTEREKLEEFLTEEGAVRPLHRRLFLFILTSWAG